MTFIHLLRFLYKGAYCKEIQGLVLWLQRADTTCIIWAWSELWRVIEHVKPCPEQEKTLFMVVSDMAENKVPGLQGLDAAEIILSR